MKHVLLGLIFIPFVAFSQPTIDGDMSDSEYTTIGTFTSGNNGFGDNNTLGAIKYYADGTHIYLGITGEIEQNGNNIILFINFSGYGGRAAGSTLGAGASVFSGIAGSAMDMDTDFALAFNAFGGGSNFYVDAARYGSDGHLNSGNLGNVGNVTGSPATFNAASQFGGSGTIDVAFSNNFDSDANKGVEFKVAIAAFAGVDNTMTAQFFTIIAGSNGSNYSNECIPGNPGASNLNQSHNFNTGSTGDFFTSFQLLPVEFTKLEVVNKNQGHLLSFTTATETNNDYFQIERSTDSRHWEKLGSIAGAGTTQQEQQYRFLDEAPLPGLNYYRVKQVDFDGSFSYSAIVSARWEGKVQVHLFPNPADDLLQISGLPATDEPITIEIIDMAGRVMLQQTWNQSAIDVAQLADGVYSLRISSSSGVIDNQRLFIH